MLGLDPLRIVVEVTLLPKFMTQDLDLALDGGSLLPVPGLVVVPVTSPTRTLPSRPGCCQETISRGVASRLLWGLSLVPCSTNAFSKR